MAEMQFSQFVRITNNGTEEVVGRFHGVDYEFLPAEPLDVPLPAAVHIFGFGQENKAAAFHRLGWLRAGVSEKQALAQLAQFTFEPVQQVFELAGKRARHEVSSHQSPGKADISEGEDAESSPLGSAKGKGR